MRCSCCGNEVREDERYCNKCGENNEGYAEKKPIAKIEIYHKPSNNSGYAQPQSAYQQTNIYQQTTYPPQKQKSMKRGIIRIIAGTAMIILQLLSIMGQASAGVENNGDIWYNIGYYGVGIAGIILLVYGIRAHNKGLYSQLVLHRKTKKFHTATKWIAFSISSLLFVMYVISFFSNLPNFNFFAILMLLATLSFSLYLLLYVYKKPSCLFSTTLIITGVAYLYGLISNLTYYMFYLPDLDNYELYIVLGVMPRLITAILYIIIATKLYKENFSVSGMKALGWSAFALECSNRILCNLVVSQTFYFYDIISILFILLTAVWFTYLSVFEINTIKGTTAHYSGYNSSTDTISVQAEQTYSINDSITPDSNNKIPNNATKMQFCRKCGNMLTEDSLFCDKCGTKIVNE